jgi:excisionase family DNA binding protein
MKNAEKRNNVESDILLAKDVCEGLKISYTTLQRLIVSHELVPLPKVGGLLRFSKKAINKKFETQIFT